MNEPVTLAAADWRRLRRGLSTGAGFVLLALAMFLVVRRMSGGFLQPLPPAILVATGVLLAATLLAVRYIDGDAVATLHSPRNYIPTLAAVLIAFSASLPGSQVGSLVLLWALVVLPELGWQGRQWAVRARPVRSASSEIEAPPATADSSEFDRSDFSLEPGGDEFLEDEGDVLPADVVQQVSQAVDSDGQVRFSGLLRARFRPDERMRLLHVAFCPPLKKVPRIAAQQIDGDAATINVAEVQVYGARIEVRRSPPASRGADVTLHFETESRLD